MEVNVDLSVLERLPQRLRDDPTTRAVSEAMSGPAAELLQGVLGLSRQFSVRTATWGLPAWERLTGITPAPGSSQEARRSAILSRLNSTGTTNAEMIRALAEALTGYSAKVTENFGEYSFSLRFYGPEAGFIRVDLGLLDSTVEVIKPAHLRFVVEPITWQNLEDAELTWEQLEAQFDSWADLETARFCNPEPPPGP